MEEGTGIGLYILVAIIIFGLFVVIAVLFGDSIEGLFTDQMTKATGAVDGYTNAALGVTP